MKPTHACLDCGLHGTIDDALGLTCPCGGTAILIDSNEYRTWKADQIPGATIFACCDFEGDPEQ